jgi:arabinofuranan 3-O-arabinosyltransferase
LQDFPPTALPEISLYEVSDAGTGARITHNPIVVSADGSGMVDLAAAGLIDGKTSIIASAALDETSLREAVLNAPEVLVTDSNRKRAHHWRGSQEVWGATEGTAALVDSFDAFDNRLPVFPLGADRLETLSIAENNSGTSMSATMYGALLSYLPEYRPANANDGNVDTSWAVGWGINPIGQTLTYTSNMGLPMVEQLELIPAQFSFDHRFVTAVSVSVDNSDWTSYTIDPDTENTTIKLNQPGNSVRVRIDAVSSGNNQLPVGWAEILPADFQHQEVITVPSDATAVVTAATPVSYSFTRLQADEYKPYRQDPEQSINRHFFVDHEDQFTLTGHATSTTDFAASDICRDDLITIDGTIIPVRLSNVEGDQDQTF